MNQKKNNALVAGIATLATLLGVMFIVVVLIFADVIPTKSSKSDSKSDQAALETGNNAASDGQILNEELELDEEVPQTPTAEENVAEKQNVTMYVANVANSIYLRSEPAENDSNIITTIPVGTGVTWHKNTNSVFSEITYSGITGYVKRDYLSAKKPQGNSVNSSNTGNTTVSKYVYVANVKNSIYLRSSASENSSNIITTIPVGTQVGYIERANSVFSKIKYNGTVGYAKTIYLSDYYTSTSYTYLTVCNVKHSIYLRSAPAENPNNIICEIPLGTKVRFIENAGGGFYKISYNGYTGYSKSIYLGWFYEEHI